MDALLSEFVADTRDGFSRVAPDLADWASNPCDKSAFESVYRFVHTVRGNAGFLGFERFERLSVPAENALKKLRDADPAECLRCAPALVALIERIGSIADAIEAGRGLAAHDEPALVAAIGEMMPEKSKSSPPAITADIKPRTVRMPAEQFDHLAQCVEAVEGAHRQLLSLLGNAPDPVQLHSHLQAVSASIASLSSALTLTRQQSLDRLCAGLNHVVETTAASLGKEAVLKVEGGDLMVDREIVDGLRDAIVHLVRNALDHGLEAPDVRIASGKVACGTITIGFEIVDGELRVSVSDDGQGIDRDAVAKEAASKCLLPINTDDDARLAQLLILPGLTTVAEPTSLSGHGVGLGAVDAAVARLGGAMTIRNQPGQGVYFDLTIPLRREARDAA
jgi:two-component system chemotaxis sensor kinase CheA